MLVKRECVDGLLQSETVACVSSMSRVVSGSQCPCNAWMCSCDGCKSLWLRMTLKSATMNLHGLSLKLSLEPCKKISECVLACTGVRKRWKMCHCGRCIVCLPSVTGRLPSLVTDHLGWKKMRKDFATMSRTILSWLQDDQVFHLLSSLHHDCQISSRMESLPARQEW